MWRKIIGNTKLLAVVLGASLIVESAMTAAAAEIQTPETQTEEQTDTAQELLELPNVTDEEIADYYAGSVFIGDSIMLGYRNYLQKQKNDMSGAMFLACGNFAVRHALTDVSKAKVYPLYKGEKVQLWDAVSEMGAKRVFILLGMNDLNITGVEGTLTNYESLVNNITEKNPDIEINIISMTYVLEGKESGKLNNDTIREFNGLLESMADENGWSYIDMASLLGDENGNLYAPYCSDGFVHLSRSCYSAVWDQEFTDYAKTRIAQEMAEAAQTEEEIATDEEL